MLVRLPIPIPSLILTLAEAGGLRNRTTAAKAVASRFFGPTNSMTAPWKFHGAVFFAEAFDVLLCPASQRDGETEPKLTSIEYILGA